MKIITFLLCFSVALTSQSPAELFQESGLPGFSIAKVNGDSLLHIESFGFENLKSKTKRTSQTRQNIASVSKTFLGVALMKTIENKMLTLDTPINDILPFQIKNPKHPDTPITIKMLANHTSSIIDYEIEYKSVYMTGDISPKNLKIKRKNKKYFKHWKKNQAEDLASFLESALLEKGAYYSKKRFSKSKPGEKHNYSNLGTALLGYIIELVVDMPLTKFIEEEIFIPLEMSNTSWDFKETKEMPPYYFENKTRVPDYISKTYPAGGINSTCEDLAKFLAELIRCYSGQGTLLNPASAQSMFSPLLNDSQNTLVAGKNYGLLMEVSGSKIGHNGGNYGVTILMSFDKETLEGRLFMTNISSYESSVLIPEMVQIYKSI